MLLLGQVVERYRVLYEVGQGGHAVVYAVEHQLLGTRHALKVPHDARLSAPRLLLEGRLQAHLDPAHVVPVTDVLEVGGRPALLMPLVEGCALARVVGRALPPPTVAALLDDVLAGMAAAHGAGIAHRDLKPANVLLEIREGHVRARVADFGVAAAAGAVDRSFVGTPTYAAPEQFVSPEQVGAAADLWAAGLVATELLLGHLPPPPEGERSGATLQQWREALLEEIPVAWRALIGGLVAPLAERIADASEARSQLRALDDHQGPLPATSELGQWLVSQTRDLVASAAEGTVAGGTEGPARDVPARGGAVEVPAAGDAFVGRTAELAQLRSALGASRLVTLVGPGGVGKTRLSRELGRVTAASWPGGVLFCDLTEARTASDVRRAVLQTLGLRPSTDDDALRAHLEARAPHLIVLDNFEQIVDHAGPTVGAWSSWPTPTRWLVTSRHALPVPGRVQTLEPLPVDDGLALFVARAGERAVHGDAEREALIELVDRIDGLPLAIELAAARARVFTPRQLLDHLDRPLRLLGVKGAARGLRGTLDSSWELLAPSERSAWSQLAVFEGGFDLEALEAVVELEGGDDAPWLADVLQELVERSLVRVVGPGRFDLLLVLREYARERLAEAPEHEAGAGARHRAHFAAMGEQASIEALELPGAEARSARYAANIENIRAAHAAAVAAGAAAQVAQLALAAVVVWMPQGEASALAELLESALDLGVEDAWSHVQVVQALAFCEHARGRSEEALRRYELARTLAADPKSLGEVLLNLAQHHYRVGSPAKAYETCRDALDVLETQPNQRLTAITAMKLGDFGRSIAVPEAEAHLRNASSRLRNVGTPSDLGYALHALAMLLVQQLRFEEAHGALHEAAELARKAEPRPTLAHRLGYLGHVAMELGHLPSAHDYLQEARDNIQGAGRAAVPSIVHLTEGDLHFLGCRFDEAWTSWQRVLSGDRKSLRRPPLRSRAERRLGILAMHRGHWAEACDRIERTMGDDAESTVGVARAQLVMARLQRARGDYQAAERWLNKACGALSELDQDQQQVLAHLEQVSLACAQQEVDTADMALKAAKRRFDPAKARPADRARFSVAEGTLASIHGQWNRARRAAARGLCHTCRGADPVDEALLHAIACRAERALGNANTAMTHHHRLVQVALRLQATSSSELGLLISRLAEDVT